MACSRSFVLPSWRKNIRCPTPHNGVVLNSSGPACPWEIPSANPGPMRWTRRSENNRTGRFCNTAVLQNRPVRLFSDLLVHRMGPGLADGISQGQAGPDEFSTTPLWGVGQRMFFLHDGRTNDLLQAILAHASPASANYPPSEGNG